MVKQKELYSAREIKINDIINRKYTYPEICIVRYTVLKVLGNCDLSTLNKQKRWKILEFLNLMVALIDDPQATVSIQSIKEMTKLIRDQPILKAKKVRKIDIDPKTTEIFKELYKWISYLMSKKEINSLLILDSYFMRFKNHTKDEMNAAVPKKNDLRSHQRHLKHNNSSNIISDTDNI